MFYAHKQKNISLLAWVIGFLAFWLWSILFCKEKDKMNSVNPSTGKSWFTDNYLQYFVWLLDNNRLENCLEGFCCTLILYAVHLVKDCCMCLKVPGILQILTCPSSTLGFNSAVLLTAAAYTVFWRWLNKWNGSGINLGDLAGHSVGPLQLTHPSAYMSFRHGVVTVILNAV